MRASRHQSIRLMITPGDADRPQLGGLSHLHVKGRVANKDRIAGRCPGCRVVSQSSFLAIRMNEL